MNITNAEHLLYLSLICIDIYLVVSAVETVLKFINAYLFSGVKALCSFLASPPVEIPQESAPPKVRYDVTEFRKRIESLKDEDGLYDIPPNPIITDFTGAEIITQNYEMELDASIGR